jgi:tRNA (guanine37-N1)-methyltransferase
MDAAPGPRRIDVVTLFPAMVAEAAKVGVTGRAAERALWALRCWNPRDYATDAYRTVDDRPYGGGPGMVMMAAPLAAAIAAAREAQAGDGVKATRVVHLTPAGRPLKHADVVAMAARRDEGLVLLAGRYEGIDERLVEREVDEEIAIGDFVVSGGELPALMLIDAIARQLPGALNDAQSAVEESFVAGLLDCRTTRGPRPTRARRCPTCSCRATTRRSAAGASSSRCAGRGSGARTCSRAGR